MALKLFYQIIARCFSYLVDFKHFQELITPISGEETLQTATVIVHLSWPFWRKWGEESSVMDMCFLIKNLSQCQCLLSIWMRNGINSIKKKKVITVANVWSRLSSFLNHIRERCRMRGDFLILVLSNCETFTELISVPHLILIFSWVQFIIACQSPETN